MSFFVQFLQQLVSHQEEETYALQILGFHTRPTISVCSHLREFRNQNNRYPTLTELVSHLYEPCSFECDYYVPFTDSIQIMEHVLVEYGFSVRCIVIHFIYMYQLLEHRYPTQDELFQYMEEHYNPSSHQELHEQQLNQMMADDVDHYWNHKHSTDEVLPSHPLSESESLQAISCCICQEEIKEGESVINLPCKHTFHSQNDNCSGIETWIQKAGNCPLCKKPIHEEEHEEHEEQQDEIYNIINVLANNLNFNEEMSFIPQEPDDMEVDDMPDLVYDDPDVPDYMDEDEDVDEDDNLDSEDDMPDLVSDDELSELIIELSINLSHNSSGNNSDDDN